jgi:glutamyl-tRNA(Gln) amidotransferase subunit E
VVTESNTPATTVAVFLTETLKALKRDGVTIENVSDEAIRELFLQVGSEQISKEALPEIFTWLSNNENKNVNQAVEALGLKQLNTTEIENLIDDIIQKNLESIDRNGKRAFGLVMGLAMKEIRGKANPEKVSDLIKQKLELKQNP